MTPAAHFLASWLIAAKVGINKKERCALTFIGVAADIDGIGLIVDQLNGNTDYYSQYHHLISHNVVFGSLLGALIYMSFKTRKWQLSLCAVMIFSLHLLADLLGSGGPYNKNWPITPFYPFSHWQIELTYQWALNSWQNNLILLTLIGLSIKVFHQKHIHPLECLGPKFEQGLKQLSQRFAKKRSAITKALK